MMRKTVAALLFTIISMAVGAQAQVPEATTRSLNQYFATYDSRRQPDERARLVGVSPDHGQKKVTVTVSDEFGYNEFTLKTVKKIKKKVRKMLPRQLRDYRLSVVTCGVDIEMLCPEANIGKSSMACGWGKIDYTGKPWTVNVSRPTTPTLGLEGRHIALWASHGRYYDIAKGRWKWQRPALFGTAEDLFTQSFVVPFLMPMLQNAGANVFSPRERDWQTNEVIVDNDSRSAYYSEQNDGESPWVKAPQKGFAMHNGSYTDGENPFVAGSARMNLTTDKARKASTATYQPLIPESGRYAVYVSYLTIDGSIDNAEYTVYHQGQATVYHVNQQMGSGTWVYLGSFYFDAGCSPRNRVVVSNLSDHDGIVTTDAVRFGGGIGNIERGSSTSGLPRSLEGARYYAQWAGAPYSVYSYSNGADDYKDDINTRSLMTNWLAGGSPFMAAREGKSVPIELSLAIHSDAGYMPSGYETVGSLAICTTDFNDGRLASGCSRQMSHDFAEALLAGIERDICPKFPSWTTRGIWDRNYSETRLPGVPSAIFEIMSHQNPADMYLGHDPYFKFLFARSIYKTILRYVSAQHGRPCVVQPLPPSCFRISMAEHGKATLAWKPSADPDEPTASPDSYIVYMAVGNGGFDNGTVVKGTSYTAQLSRGQLYRFRVTAANRGGESFPTATLAAAFSGDAAPTALIIDGFSRMAAPQIINNETQRGFDMASDMGVSYGLAAEWLGHQQVYSPSHGGREGSNALGYTDNSLMGRFVMGNQMDNAAVHAGAIHAAGGLNIVSCTMESMEKGIVKPDKKTLIIDLAFGLQKDDGYSTRQYKTFGPVARRVISAFRQRGGNLLSSGAYIMTDMLADDEQAFSASNMACTAAGKYDISGGNTIKGLGTSFSIISEPNAKHFACRHADILIPATNAFAAMQYADGSTAAVVSESAYGKTFTAGFPLECISDTATFKAIMKGIIGFLMK